MEIQAVNKIKTIKSDKYRETAHKGDDKRTFFRFGTLES
jgi:hypothetical protein